MVKVGDSIPEFVLQTNANSTEDATNPTDITTHEVFANKTVILFGVPGAFTPTCSSSHLPGYIKHQAQLASLGVDLIACLCPNDVYVADAWAKQAGAQGKVKMLADGNGLFAEALGLGKDMTKDKMGAKRVQRFALIAKNGVVSHLAVGGVDVSGAEPFIEHLSKEQ
ncbi:hypothetical protein HDV03_003303 [Kappamyces sp. JEL0829]|nr:hypothetical protein HDV03_003303 [Kappamyces sp. JEL0829]